MQPIRGHRRTLVAAVLALGLVASAAACGGDDGDDGAGGDGLSADREEVRAVPEEYDTIQEAVDAADEGDLVLVSPGIYKESVTVTTDDLVIRGLDRNEVILDGEYEKDNGIRVLEADGVAVENMTARNYTTNGFYWVSAEGYRGSYLTAHNNGDYGIYAFDSTVGLFEHSYGSGSPDAGFYIGQCYPCDAVIRDVVAEHNGLGYSGTNAGGDLYIVDSVFRENRAGIVPNSGSYELYPPERETTIVGNLVYANNNYDTAAIDSARRAGGNGILVAGGNDNVIERNRIFDHDITGVAVVLIDDAEAPGGFYWPSGNVVQGNVIEDSRLADIGMVQEDDGGNCFADNEFTLSAPVDIEALAPCEGEGSGDPDQGALDITSLASLDDKPESGDYRDMPPPDPQQVMPDADSADWEPAGAPPEIDIDSIDVPESP